MPVKGNTKLLHEAWDRFMADVISYTEEQQLRKDGTKVNLYDMSRGIKGYYGFKIEDMKKFERKVIALLLKKGNRQCIADDIRMELTLKRPNVWGGKKFKIKE